MEVVEVGAKLRDARVARGLSLDDIAGVTKVPKSMLALLETDAFHKMPAPVFVRGFIRAYAKVVAIDPNPVVRAYEQRTLSLEAMAANAPPPHPYGRTHDDERSREVREARLQRAAGRDSRIDREADGNGGSNPTEVGPRTRNSAATDRKLTPLQPVSERREGSFRGGYALLAVVAIGLLIAAWLMVGGKHPPSDTSARAPGVNDPGGPALHERIDGVPSLEAPRARAGLGGASDDGIGEVPRVR
ncbi:MAG: helix-turn-helix domain-containing protein [Myxococcota bacterium]